MSEILKASEIPPGARLLGRQAQAMTGTELARGIGGLVERVAGELARVACEGAIERGGWAQRHLTFPRAKVEWVPCDGGIWLRLVFGTGGAWDWEWQSGKADIREMVQVGPFGSPDDMREALSLPRVAQFKLPSGEVVTAELPGAALRSVEVDHAALRREVEEAVERMAERTNELVRVPVLERPPAPETTIDSVILEPEQARDKWAKDLKEVIVNPLTGAPIEPQGGGFVKQFSEPALVAEAELLAEPPRVATDARPVVSETGKPIVNVAGKEPKFGKGSRGKKGASNGN